MIITCEKCTTRFVLDDALIKPEGSMLRCSKCQHVFTAYPKEYPEIGLSDQSEAEGQDIPFDESQIDPQSDFNLSQGDDSDRDRDSYSQDTDQEDTDSNFSEIEFEVEALEETSSEDQTDASSTNSQSLEIEIEEPSDDFDENELEFDISDFEIDGLEMETQEIGDENASASVSPSQEDDMADIEISFSQDDDADLELDDLSFEMEDEDQEAPSIDALELETQNEDLKLETQNENLELEVQEDGDLDVELKDEDQEDLILEEDDDDDDLELSPDSEDALTDDFALQQEETIEAHPDTAHDDFFIDDSDEPEDLHLDENIELSASEQDKFAEYDGVLEQETEPEDTDIAIHDPDEEDDMAAVPLSPADDEIETAPEPLSEQAPSVTPLSAQSVRQKRSSKRKKGSPALIILLALVLLLVAAYVAIIRLGVTIPVVSDIQIPYINQWIKPKQAPPAPLKPLLDEPSINGRFVSNKSAGDLFIITGKVKNPSDKAVSYIRVKGTLMKKNNIKAETQIAYCGNIISEEKLKSDNISDITKQMSVKQGNQNTNVNIKPGASVMFMLVFSDLPDDLANFTVALEGFEPAQE